MKVLPVKENCLEESRIIVVDYIEHIYGVSEHYLNTPLEKAECFDADKIASIKQESEDLFLIKKEKYECACRLICDTIKKRIGKNKEEREAVYASLLENTIFCFVKDMRSLIKESHFAIPDALNALILDDDASMFNSGYAFLNRWYWTGNRQMTSARQNQTPSQNNQDYGDA